VTFRWSYLRSRKAMRLLLPSPWVRRPRSCQLGISTLPWPSEENDVTTNAAGDRFPPRVSKRIACNCPDRQEPTTLVTVLWVCRQDNSARFIKVRTATAGGSVASEGLFSFCTKRTFLRVGDHKNSARAIPSSSGNPTEKQALLQIIGELTQCTD
jgi:hypothetical protein